VAHPFLDSEQWCLRESAKVPVTKIDFRLPSFLHSICSNISVLENQEHTVCLRNDTKSAGGKEVHAISDLAFIHIDILPLYTVYTIHFEGAYEWKFWHSLLKENLIKCMS